MEATNSKKFIDILKSPFVILYNIVTYALVGIKFLGFDFWADLYNGTSYRVSRTYEATKQAFMADEEKIYERTKKKPKKEKEKPVIQNAFVYEDLEERIKSIIGSKVHVNHKANGKGKIEIEYYSDNDLERIFELLMSIQEGK